MTVLRCAALVIALHLVPSPAVRAQVRPGDAGVRGVVATKADIPIPLAIVELHWRPDSSLVQRGQSGEAGRFQFTGIAEGAYYLVLRAIGYGSVKTFEFTVAPGAVRDVGLVRLEASAVELETVVVTVERPDVVFEPDRTGYLVEALAGTTGGVVTDAFRGIPDLAVEMDGTVRLRGVTPAIYINGRPAPFTGVSLAVFLEQFPANQIERVEVIDVPPARFGAEGGGGIINIVLKAGVELGVTGSASLAWGTRGQRTASGRATMQRGPWVVTGGLNTRWSDSENADFTLRQNLLADPITFLQQDARSDRSSRSGGASADIRYEVSKNARLWADFNGDLNGNDRNGLTTTSNLDQAQLPTLRYGRLATAGGNGGSGNAEVGYMYSWVPNRHTLEIQANASSDRSTSDTREEIVPDPEYAGSVLLPAWLTERSNADRGNNQGFEVDYRRPAGSAGRIEIGSSLRRSETSEEQSTALFDVIGGTTPDESEFRRVSRVQRIFGSYLTLQQRMGKFGIVAGLRSEVVGTNVVLPEGALLTRNEANLFPSLNLSWAPSQRAGVRLGYSRRISRPGVSILDPTDRSTDPLNRSVGNPDIKSSTTHNLVATFSWSGRLGQLSLGPYWNQTLDGWERITTVDDAGISTSTYANLTSRTSLGTSLNYGLPRLRSWRTRVNVSASHSTLKGSVRNSSQNNGQVFWSAGANVDGTLFGGMSVQGSFGYQPGRQLAQGRSSGQWRADFSFRYRLMNNRTSIGLSIQDPFELRRTTQTIQDPSVIQTGSSRTTTRSLNLNLSYAFGGGGGRGGGDFEVRRD